MKKVLIVDDHPLARLAVKMMLEKDKMEVIGETDDGQEGILLTRQLNPDLMVVDIDIPSISGIDMVKRIRQDGFTGGVLVLSGKDDDHYIRRCITAGANGFISKRHELNELHDAIRAIKGGYSYFPLSAARFAVTAPDEQGDKNRVEDLSVKELMVLRYLARGLKIVDVAQLMQLSDKTVSTYKRRLMQKLEVKNMLELYDFIQRNKLD